MPYAWVRTRISEGAASSRAEGVTIVLEAMKILRPSWRAARTSASQTKSTGVVSMAGGPAGRPGAGGASGEGCAAGAGGPASQEKPVLEDRAAMKRSTTSAAAFETTEAAGADAGSGWEHEQESADAEGATATPREAR